MAVTRGGRFAAFTTGMQMGIDLPTFWLEDERSTTQPQRNVLCCLIDEDVFLLCLFFVYLHVFS